MDKTELLEALEDGRSELIEMLEDLPDEVLLEPGVCGDWSIKDILAHLVQWEGQMVTLLFQARQGMKKPTTAHFGTESVDDVNARWFEASKDRSLDIIWQDLTGVRKQTIRRVTEFSEKELNDPNLFPWLKGTPLWEWIANDSFGHDEEHGEQIAEWLERRESRNNGHNAAV